jgi:3-phosphoshikimate 1-carboxyvinyltransferase
VSGPAPVVAPSALPSELRLGGAAPLRGRLRPPGDKSISHRSLLFAAIADGRSRIEHLGPGDDIACTRAALLQLGVRITDGRDGSVSVFGRGFEGLREPAGVIDCGNSGTSTRLLAGLLSGSPFLSVLTGDESLVTRPMRRVVDPLRAMGATIDGRADATLAPLVIRGARPLYALDHVLEVASAQVKSALVLAALQADGPCAITEPAPSRDHTERMLRALGVDIVPLADLYPSRADAHGVRVEPGAPESFEIVVPGDPSSAAFFVVAACITPGSEIVINDVSLNPTRIGFLHVLRRMGADIEIGAERLVVGEPVGSLTVRSSELHSTVIGGDEIPNVIDEIPVLAVAAAFADGVTEIRDAAELRVKESNRIGALDQELTQLGVAVESKADGLVIRGGAPRAATLKSHGDHRIAMAAAVALHALDAESSVRGWSAVASSYPGFAADLYALIARP